MLRLSDDATQFPPYSEISPSGIIAVGGKITTPLLLNAYKRGIFPWYNEDEPVLWWCPDPRFVLYPEKLKVSKSMRNILNRDLFYITENQCFAEVMRQCKNIARSKQEGTWINNEMLTAYTELHEQGYAKSVEVWNQKNELVGGLYGIEIHAMFCGESMFSKESNASKAALIHLVRNHPEYRLIDCQVYTEHLESMGAENIERSLFLSYCDE